MRDMIWEIAKSCDESLDNTELNLLKDPEDLFIARGLSIEAKDSTYKINKFVDNKIANDVSENGAIKIGEFVFNFSKGYKTESQDVKKLLQWATNKELSEESLNNLISLVGQNFVPKLRGLDAVANNKGMDKQLARDTFIEKVWDEVPKLQVIKTTNDAAPVWAKDLKEMERRK